MDNDFNEIDDLFKSRFEGVKDHSVNPTSQWASFESELNGSMAKTTSHSSGMVMRNLSMAASVAGIIGIALLAQSDVSQLSSPSVETAEQQSGVMTNPTETWTNYSQSPFLNSVAFQGAFDLSHHETQNTRSLDELISDGEKSSGVDNNLIATTETDATLVDSKNLEKSTNASFNRASSKRSTHTFASLISRSNLSLMAPLQHEEEQISLVDANRSMEAADYYNKSGVASDFFLRLGVRFGNGESNSPQNPNAWTANAMASIGYKRAISTKYGWMAELAYLRRSGNGLERNQNLEVERSYSAYNTSFNAGGNNPLDVVPDFSVDRSLIATRLDYVQIPISMYYDANQKVSLNAGIYGEFLFNAQNKAYVIYNNVNYVALNTSDEEKGSVEGLNRLRYGVSVGANYEIMQNLRLDVRALVPINSTFSSNTTMRADQNANRSLDLMISLKYSI